VCAEMQISSGAAAAAASARRERKERWIEGS
jgi:hypothetical protein